MLALIILSTVALGGFLYFKNARSDAADNGETASRKKRTQPYAGVEIHCGQHSCGEAKRLRGTRLLASNAPVLPLIGCDAETCTCAYRKWDDRRQDHRRSSDDGLEPIIFSGRENRENDGRRDKDKLVSGF